MTRDWSLRETDYSMSGHDHLIWVGVPLHDLRTRGNLPGYFFAARDDRVLAGDRRLRFICVGSGPPLTERERQVLLPRGEEVRQGRQIPRRGITFVCLFLVRL